MSRFTKAFKLLVAQRYEKENISYRELENQVGVDNSVIRYWVMLFRHHGDKAFDFPYTNYSVAFKLRIIQFINETNSSIRVNSHSFSPTITTGIVRGGSSFIEHAGTVNGQSSIYHNHVLSSGTTYSNTWNFNAVINSSSKSIIVRQFLYPSNYVPSDHCIDNDSFVFLHGSLLAGNPINSELNSTFNVNSSKVQIIENNLSLLGFNEMREVNLDSMLLKSFIFDNKLVEMSVHNTPVEIMDDIIDTKTYGNINVYTTQNVEGTNVYTLEINDNDQYIYVISTIEPEDLLTLIE